MSKTEMRELPISPDADSSFLAFPELPGWLAYIDQPHSALAGVRQVALSCCDTPITLEFFMDRLSQDGEVHTAVLHPKWGSIVVEVFNTLIINCISTFIEQSKIKNYDPIAAMETLMFRFRWAIQDALQDNDIRLAQGREKGAIMDMKRYLVAPSESSLNGILSKISENIGILKSLPHSAIPPLLFAVADYNVALLQMGELTAKRREYLDLARSETKELMTFIDEKSKHFPAVVTERTSKVMNEASDDSYTTNKFCFYYGEQRIKDGPGKEIAKQQRKQFMEDKIVEARREIFMPAWVSTKKLLDHLNLME